MLSAEPECDRKLRRMWRRDGFTISTDRAHLDLDVIWLYLHDESYWASGVPRELVERSVEHSLNFGLFDGASDHGGRQIGYCRVVTDRATFAWLCDVFVLPAYRGRGLATWLVETVSQHPDLQVQRSFVLATRDAHGLYAKFGWQPVEAGRFMRISRPYRSVE
jgi:GNAT superfamily N-acetyltransferase